MGAGKYSALDKIDRYDLNTLSSYTFAYKPAYKLYAAQHKITPTLQHGKGRLSGYL